MATGMVRPVGAAVVLAMAIALALLLPPAAPGAPVAGPEVEVQPRNLRLQLSLKGSNGYSGFIFTRGHKRVTLAMIKGEAIFVATTSGQVNRHGVEAEFGDLAEISVRFEGERVPWREPSAGQPRGIPPRPCRGRDPVLEAGTFQGAIRFRGDNDFTRIATGSAPGTVERHYRRVCAAALDLRQLEELLGRVFGRAQVTLLRAIARADGTTDLFQASATDLASAFGAEGGASSYSFAAGRIEREDGMRIIRAFGATGSEKSFEASDKDAKRQTATVTPPKPFAGSATYVKQTGAPAGWTGSLSVRLPGSGLVPLTGPDFDSLLCHMRLRGVSEGVCQPEQDRIAPGPFSLHGFSSGQRLPVPDLLRSKALLTELAAELR